MSDVAPITLPPETVRAGRMLGQSRWMRWASIGVVVALAAGLWTGRWQGTIDLRFDASVYYLLGTSLAKGEGYRISSEPGAPEGVQYPPLLPVIVAAHQRALGTTDPSVVGPVLRRTFAGLYIAYGLAVLALARACLPPLVALLAAVLCLAHINSVIYSDMLFTELPFGVVAVAFAGVLGTARLDSRPRLRGTLAFALAAAGFLLRTAGLALLLAWVGEAVVRRRWRAALLRGLFALLPFAGWQAHVWRVRHSAGYEHGAYAYQRAPYQFYNVTYRENMTLANPFRPEFGRTKARTIVRRVGTNLLLLPMGVAEAITARHGFWRGLMRGPVETAATQRAWANRFTRFPLFLVSAIMALGLLALWRQRRRAFVLFALVSVAMVCTTPWPQQQARYLSPLAPFLAIAAGVGAIAIDDWLRTRRATPVLRLGRLVLPGVAVVAVAAQAYALQIVYGDQHKQASLVEAEQSPASRLFYYDARWVAWERAVHWVQRAAAPTDVVITAAPHLCYLSTGLHAVFPPMERDPARAGALMASVPARWVIVDEFEFLDITRRYALPAVLSNPAQWRLVHTEGGVKIFRRVDATGTPAPSPLRS